MKIHACFISMLTAAAVVVWALPLRAESKQREALRTDEAETPERMTDKPLKAAMQNLFLQEDPFPQQHLQVQAGLRIVGDQLNDEAGLNVSAAAELGLVDSWTVSMRVPVSLWPADDRGLGNPELGVLYSIWVSRHEDFRLTTNLRNVFPSTIVGERAFAHDLSVIGYARWAPLHVQAVATLDVSYGKDIEAGPRARPEGSVAAIIKLEKHAWVLEAAAQREFNELRYLGALGVFVYPGSFEIGLAATLDVTKKPVTLGAVGVISYAFDPPK